LEPFAARLGVPRLSGRDLDRLNEIYAEMEDATHHRDIVRLLQLAPDFHMTIYRAGGTERLVQIIRSLWESTQPYRRSFLTDDLGTQSALEEHRRI
jgi:DNA-binding GntR family transcriptional regulator